MQRMSGIATNTHNFVSEIETETKILDTRKTTPNLRILERQAVRDGGGFNHRYSLSDMVLIRIIILMQLVQLLRRLVLLKQKLI